MWIPRVGLSTEATNSVSSNVRDGSFMSTAEAKPTPPNLSPTSAFGFCLVYPETIRDQFPSSSGVGSPTSVTLLGLIPCFFHTLPSRRPSPRTRSASAALVPLKSCLRSMLRLSRDASLPSKAPTLKLKPPTLPFVFVKKSVLICFRQEVSASFGSPTTK